MITVMKLMHIVRLVTICAYNDTAVAMAMLLITAMTMAMVMIITVAMMMILTVSSVQMMMMLTAMPIAMTII